MDEEQKQGLEYFKDRLPVDQFSLEEECREQPSLLAEVGSWVSGIKADAKVKKKRVEFVEADLSLKVRKNPKEYSLSETGRITDTTVHSVVLTIKEYQDAVSASIEADKLANEASILLSSVEQRGSSIRDLVKLFIYSYYSSPDNAVNREGWEKAEEAIVALRNGEDQQEERSEEE